MTLWRALTNARRDLRERNAVASAVEQAFAREIEPRERRFTEAALQLTTRLMDLYDVAVLDRASRSLLGLWIAENLERLDGHPFADQQAVRATRRRWRNALHPRAAVAERGGIDGALGALLDRADDRVADPAPGPARHDEQEKHVPDNDERAAPIDVAAMLPGSDPNDDPERRLRELVERLFRRVAPTLHPDRESDPTQRQLKQALMRRALEARRSRDLDTLLELHLTHVGETLDVVDVPALEAALQRQLEGMRQALRRAVGDPVRRRIVERYGAPDEERRRVLIARHADLLDAELERVQSRHAALGSPDETARAQALSDALDERRERELDRLTIDEITGAR